MNKNIRENIAPLEEAGKIWPLLKELEAKTFNFTEDFQPFTIFNKDGSLVLDETGEPVVEYRDINESYPKGIQLLIDSSKAQLLYPESVINQEGEEYVRMDLFTILLFQAVKEIYKEFSDRLSVLEAK